MFTGGTGTATVPLGPSVQLALLVAAAPSIHPKPQRPIVPPQRTHAGRDGASHQLDHRSTSLSQLSSLRNRQLSSSIHAVVPFLPLPYIPVDLYIFVYVHLPFIHIPPSRSQIHACFRIPNLVSISTVVWLAGISHLCSFALPGLINLVVGVCSSQLREQLLRGYLEKSVVSDLTEPLFRSFS